METQGANKGQFHQNYIQKLQTVFKMASSYKDDNPFQAFVNNVLPYINDIIHEIVKKGLDKILGRLYEVQLSFGQFKEGKNIQKNQYQESTRCLSYIVDFEKAMLEIQTNVSTSGSSQKQLIKLINAYPSLAYQACFTDSFAFQYFGAQTIFDILQYKSSKIQLQRTMQGVDMTLLQWLLTSYKGFTNSHAENLKRIISAQGIPGQKFARCNLTYNELFSKCFSNNSIIPKQNIKIVEYDFQTFIPNKESLSQLQLKQFDQKQLKNLIESFDYFEKDFQINYKPIKINCNNNQINVKFDNIERQLRCCFPPVINRFVDWKILVKSNNDLIHLNQDNSKQVTELVINFKQSKQPKIFSIFWENKTFSLRIMNKLRVVNIQNIEQTFGDLIWIPSYKKQPEQPKDLIADQQEQLSNSQDLISIIQQPSLPKKQQRKFQGLGYLQNYLPTSIDSSTYQLNEMTIVCSNPSVSLMIQDFQNKGIPLLLSQYLGGEEIFSISYKDIDKTKQLAKFLNIYSKTKNLPLLKAEYFDKNNKVAVGKFVNKNCLQFVQLFCKYLSKKQINKIKNEDLQLSSDKIQILEAIERVAPITTFKAGARTLRVQSDPLTMQIIKTILVNEKVKQKLDMLDQLEHLQKEEKCYMKNLISNIKINKLKHPTFEFECESKYLAEFLNKLYSAKLSLAEIKRNNGLNQITDYQNIKFFPKFQKLRMYPDVVVKLTGKDKQNIASIVVSFPKKIQSTINSQLNRIKKEIAHQSINTLTLSNESFSIQNVKHQIAIKITNVMKDSLQRFKMTAKFNPKNTIEKSIQPAIQIKQQPNIGIKITLTNGVGSYIEKFNEDKKIIEGFIQAYRKQLSRFSSERMEHFINFALSFYRVSPQRTTQQRKANNLIRNLLAEQVKKVIWPLNQNKLQLLDQQAMTYLDKNFGQIFKPNAFESFKKECQDKCRINVFDIFLETTLENHSKTSRIQQAKIKKYQEQIRSFMKPTAIGLQKKYEKGQVIPIKDILSFQRSIRINSSIFFANQLPIVQHLQSFKQKLERARIMVVKTGTGSGKSTVLPPFMLGLGYKKVYVTQPRRLPCKRICQRISDTNGSDIVGYRLGGGISKNAQNDLIYITDGLLKEIIYKDDTFLKNVDVIMLDEVHEQTKSVDLIILLLRKLMDKYSKLKVILCSATVNESLLNLFDKKHHIQTFEVPINMHKVTEHQITNTSILEKVKNLYIQLSNTDQMLVFFPSVSQVQQYRKIFQQEYGIKAYGLYGNQKPQIQEEAMTKGRVIFSTSIAETSLTFSGLKIVVDSQKSRIQMYDIKQKMMVSRQLKSSASSIKQRKGRLGRTQPGDYYYMVYNDQSESFDYDLSELDRSELLNVCFELLMKYEDWAIVEAQLLALKVHDPVDFKSKLQQAKKILCSFDDLIFRQGSSKISQICKQQIFCYGNMGNMYFNISLYKSIILNCFQNMVAVVSFAMLGIPIYQHILKNFSGNRTICTGDLEVAGQFLLDTSRKMRLQSIKSRQVYGVFNKLVDIKKYSNMATLLVRIIMQMKKLFSCKPKFIQGTQDWKIVNRIIAESFSNNLFFNRSMIGGNNRYFEKIVPDMIYHPNLPIEIVNEVQFVLNINSILYNKAQKQPFIVALGSVINPFSSCTLSFCCKAQIQTLKTRISLSIQQHTSALGKLQIIKQKDIYDPRMGAKGTMMINRNNNLINIRGSFYQVLNQYAQLNNHLRKNWATDIEEWLLAEIADRVQIPNRRPILPQDIKANFQKLNLFKLFTPLTRQFKTLYNVQIKWKNKGKVEINQASNFVMSIFTNKIKGFLSWFVQAQNVITEDVKQHPVQPDLKKQYTREVLDGIMKRINQIVDPKIDLAILKSWVSGVYSKVPIRVYRMIAVCWVLVNQFNCCIKGGFIRDWVVNGQFKNLSGPQNDMLQPFNGFYRIKSNSIVPADIDVDLSEQIPFNFQEFKKIMNKLGIKVIMKDDGWRYLLAFDVGQVTGGFTADLIHPYCYVSHDNYDFDVNIMYIKGGCLNLIGLKVPLKLRCLDQGADSKQFEVSIQQLISRCRAKKMRKIRTLITEDRIRKFQQKDREWSIDVATYEPVIQLSLKTSFHYLTKEELNKYDPKWVSTMINKQGFTVLSAQLLKNYCFETGYDSAKCWVAKETNDLNQITLYHGASQDGANGVAQAGFDSRFYGKAFGQTFGRGAYFADDPKYSDGYVTPNNNQQRHMLICKVVLGKMQIMDKADNKKMGPSQGFHSIKAIARQPNMQYILDRWGQARPFILIKYRK